MTKLKTFWYTFKKSITSFSYYKHIVKANFSFSLKYLFLLLFLASLFGSIKFAANIATLIPKIPNFITEVKTSAQNFYPKELIVKVQNGQVSTNVKEPYFLDINAVKSHFVTIDTKAKVEDFLKYKTLILVTKDSIVTQDKETSYRVYPLSELTKNAEDQNIVIDKKGYDAVVAKALPYLNNLMPLAVILIVLSVLLWPFIATAFTLLGKLIYLFFITIIVFVIAKIMKSDLSFGKIYQMGMHAVTIPVVLVLIFNLAGYPSPALVPSIILIVFLSKAILGFKKS